MRSDWVQLRNCSETIKTISDINEWSVCSARDGCVVIDYNVTFSNQALIIKVHFFFTFNDLYENVIIES